MYLSQLLVMGFPELKNLNGYRPHSSKYYFNEPKRVQEFCILTATVVTESEEPNFIVLSKCNEFVIPT